MDLQRAQSKIEMGLKRRAELEEDQEVLKKKLKEINDNSVRFNALLLFYFDNFSLVLLYYLAFVIPLMFLAA